MTTAFYHSANPISIETLATHYGKRVITSSGRRGFRMGCPAHLGEKPNCAVFESDNAALSRRNAALRALARERPRGG